MSALVVLILFIQSLSVLGAPIDSSSAYGFTPGGIQQGFCGVVGSTEDSPSRPDHKGCAKCGVASFAWAAPGRPIAYVPLIFGSALTSRAIGDDDSRPFLWATGWSSRAPPRFS